MRVSSHGSRLPPPSYYGPGSSNGSSIKTFGKRLLEVSFASGHRFSHRFWIATIKRPILGADFFSEHGLLIDILQCRLIDRTGFTYPATLSSVPSIAVLRLPAGGPYESLLENFPSLLVQNFAGQVKHNVRHYVLTCLLYTSPSPRDLSTSRMPSSA